jgi:hypothetical protein
MILHVRMCNEGEDAVVAPCTLMEEEEEENNYLT